MREAMRPVLLIVNGRPVEVAEGTTVAAAVLISGAPTRRSVSGEARAPLCGMGICFECRVAIDGRPHQRSCQVVCAAEMDVRTL
jgi:sarcosine oxidase subunit alpha